MKQILNMVLLSASILSTTHISADTHKDINSKIKEIDKSSLNSENKKLYNKLISKNEELKSTTKSLSNAKQSLKEISSHKVTQMNTKSELTKRNNELDKQIADLQSQVNKKNEEKQRKDAEEKQKQEQAKQAEVKSSQSSSSPSKAQGTTSNASYSSSQVKEAFDRITSELGVTGSDKATWEYVISVESGWNPQATNPSSGAYGLGQALPAGKMAEFGSDYMTNPYTQLKWMYSYIMDRYHSFANLQAFWDKNHWY